MAPGIRDKVAIIGMGCTRFGELWDKGPEDLMVDAFKEALDDAKIEKKDIQAAWQGGPEFVAVSLGDSACPLAETLKLPYIPVTRVENMCASGSEAFRAACYAVAAGACDIAMALGVEKLKDTGYGHQKQDYRSQPDRAGDVRHAGYQIFPKVWHQPAGWQEDDRYSISQKPS